MSFIKRFFIFPAFLAACALILPSSAALCGEAVIKVISPSEIGEFAAPDNSVDDDTYGYRADPKGKCYHFRAFVSDGDSQWDVFFHYEEQFTATSTLKPIKNITYGPENLRNSVRGGGDRDDVWCEGVKGYGIGERVNMRVITQAWHDRDDEIYFTALMLVNGHSKNETTWKNNSRVKILRLYVGGKPWCDLKLEDTIKPQIFDFGDDERIYPSKSGIEYPEQDAFTRSLEPEYAIPKGPVYQTDLSFEIIEVYPGAKYDDTCITGIALDVYGDIY